MLDVGADGGDVFCGELGGVVDDEVELFFGVMTGVDVPFLFPEVGGACELGDDGDGVVCEMI